MTSYNKRKQQVNQLRKAHFPFGYQDNRGAQSQYIQRYKQYEIQMQKKTQNARKANFSVTDPNGDTNYISQFKQRYPEHPLGNRQGAIKNPTDKNFIFGYDGPAYDTNYKDQYVKKKSDIDPKLKPGMDARQPHIILGDSLTDFTTTYNQIHNAKQPTKSYANDPQLIRKSNMILGNDSPNYQTQNSATFVPKPITNYHATHKNNNSSLNFGNDKPTFTSQNRNKYAHKDAPYVPVDQARIQDFRASHFPFGFPAPQNHISQAMANYNQKPINYQVAQPNYKSNLNLSPDPNTNYTSSYVVDFPQKKLPDNQLNKIKPNQDEGVVIGMKSDPGMYTSQNHAKFGQPIGAQPIQISKGRKPGQGIQFGDGNRYLQTHYNDIHTDKFNLRDPVKVSPEQLIRLRKNNFQNGFADREYYLSSNQYGKKLNNAVRVFPGESSKANNVIDSNAYNPFKGSTTYKDSFLWKKGEQ